MTIFERIKELADKQGKSLQKISEDLGLSQNYIYNLKGAKSPAADKLAMIADYFGVSVDYLLGRSDFINDNILLDKAIDFYKKNIRGDETGANGIRFPEDLESLSDFDLRTRDFAVLLAMIQEVYSFSNAKQKETLNNWIDSSFNAYSKTLGRGQEFGEKFEDILSVLYKLLVDGFIYSKDGSYDNTEYIEQDFDKTLGELNIKLVDFIEFRRLEIEKVKFKREKTASES